MEFESNPNIGLYMFVNDKFAIIGKQVSETKKKEIEEVLQVPIYVTTILSTDLVGIFAAGNNDFLVLPDLYDYELKVFEEICEKHDVKLIKLENKLNTFGNNLCFGNKTILINHIYPKDFKDELAKQTKYKIVELKNPEFENAGAIAVYKNDKYFISQEISEEEAKEIASEVGAVGTINAGSNFVASGIVGNSNGILIGSMSTSIEIQNVVEGLNYL